MPRSDLHGEAAAPTDTSNARSSTGRDPIAMASLYVYCSCSERGEIARFLFDERAGRLEYLGTTTLPDALGPATSLPLALSRDHRILFAAVRVQPFRIVSMAIDPGDGDLRALASAPTAGALAYISVDGSGRHLLGASVPDSLLVSHRIDIARGVTAAPAHVVTDVAKAHSIVVEPGNRFVYAAALGENRLRQMSLDVESGRLSPLARPFVDLHAGAGPRHLAFHPSLNLLYCLNETDGTISVFDRDARDGMLAHVQTVDMFASTATRPANVRAADIAIEPSGKFLYASERSYSTLVTFAIDLEHGTLTRRSAMPTEASPRGMRLTPAGRHLAVAGELSGNLALYAIDAATGQLLQVAQAGAGAGANWIVMVAGND